MFSTLLYLSLIHLFFFLLSLYQVRSKPKEIKFIYHWAFPYSAFVWEDLLVFSFFYYLITIITLATRDLRIGTLLLLVFWIVRSAGETFYFFLQQFHQPQHPPHAITNHFNIFKKLLNINSPQKSYILMQTFHQILLTVFITLLILLVIHWTSLNWLLI